MRSARSLDTEAGGSPLALELSRAFPMPSGSVIPSLFPVSLPSSPGPKAPSSPFTSLAPVTPSPSPSPSPSAPVQSKTTRTLKRSYSSIDLFRGHHSHSNPAMLTEGRRSVSAPSPSTGSTGGIGFGRGVGIGTIIPPSLSNPSRSRSRSRLRERLRIPPSPSGFGSAVFPPGLFTHRDALVRGGGGGGEEEDEEDYENEFEADFDEDDEDEDDDEDEGNTLLHIDLQVQPAHQVVDEPIHLQHPIPTFLPTSSSTIHPIHAVSIPFSEDEDGDGTEFEEDITQLDLEKVVRRLGASEVEMFDVFDDDA
ncbi:hypothetical protein BDQ17DRAFT_1360913 [Cyathus striatus]|nr:hypothetical protein BDQ17DRAFT_1360913 [Cyathus striatus]